MRIIETENLTKVYRRGMNREGITALDSVSFSMEQGEIMGLIGPNGAGKTTLVKTLLGITHPSSGYVAIGGSQPSDPQSRSRVGFLPENHRFPAHLSGIGLLKNAGNLMGLKNSQIERRCEELLRIVDMEKWGTTNLRKYSKGMLQRIGLAQALVGDPDLLLLDEPTDGVDPMGKLEIRRVIERLKQEGKSVLLNSHLLSEVESLADRVAILDRGKIVRLGSVVELTSRQSQFEIEAEIGENSIDVPPEIGRRVFISVDRLVVELNKETDLDSVIDLLRSKQIRIRSVKPLKISLEQSFFESVAPDRAKENQ